jgi:uncharacterized membrane protein
MAKRTTTRGSADAPPASRKDPNPAAAGLPDVHDNEDSLVGRTVTINRPRHELYAFWREVRNLPLFMENVVSVTVVDDRTSNWVMQGPGDSRFDWTSTIVEDVPGESIAWTSGEDASVPHSGRIEFRDSPNGRGTIVTATIAYDPPGGALGKLVAKAARKDPNAQARHDLRRFKQLAETGEIATSERPADAA